MRAVENVKKWTQLGLRTEPLLIIYQRMDDEMIVAGGFSKSGSRANFTFPAGMKGRRSCKSFQVCAYFLGMATSAKCRLSLSFNFGLRRKTWIGRSLVKGLGSAHEGRSGEMRPLAKPAIRSTGSPG